MNIFKQPKIGIVGLGFVGGAIRDNMEDACDLILVDNDPSRGQHTYKDLADCEGIFIAVPSPQGADGKCDTSILESVLEKLKDYKGDKVIGALSGKSKKRRKTYTHFDQAGYDKELNETIAAEKANRESGDYGSLMKSFDNSMFEKDPGYNFRLEEGNRGVQGSLAARGGLFSGQAGKALNSYNQGFASNEFGAAASRYDKNRSDTYNMLSGNATMGQNLGAQQMGAYNMMGDTMATMGANKAAATMGMANAISDGIGQGYNQYNANRYLGILGAQQGQPSTQPRQQAVTSRSRYLPTAGY
jgi:hypothetical protein